MLLWTTELPHSAVNTSGLLYLCCNPGFMLALLNSAMGQKRHVETGEWLLLLTQSSVSIPRGLMPRTLDSQITLEKTPSYFVTQEAPRRISSMSHETKLIVVVRNPVTRAISDYTQTLSKKPDIPTFEELAFKNRSLGLVDSSWNAIRIGMYILHLENWLQYFRLSQMHFVSGERLITDPAGEMGRVQDFLGLKRIITDKHFYFNRTKGFPCLKKPESSSQPRCLGKSKGRTHVQIEQEVIEQLQEFYRPFNIKFYETVGQDFKWDWVPYKDNAVCKMATSGDKSSKTKCLKRMMNIEQETTQSLRY